MPRFAWHCGRECQTSPAPYEPRKNPAPFLHPPVDHLAGNVRRLARRGCLRSMSVLEIQNQRTTATLAHLRLVSRALRVDDCDRHGLPAQILWVARRNVHGELCGELLDVAARLVFFHWSVMKTGANGWLARRARHHVCCNATPVA